MSNKISEKFQVSFVNIPVLAGVIIDFNNPRDIANTVWDKGKQKFLHKPSIKLKNAANTEEAKKVIVTFFNKITSRKKGIYDTIIKGQDSLLWINNVNDPTKLEIERQKNDGKISLFDIINFFGPQNIKISCVNKELDELYRILTETNVRRLGEIYSARVNDYKHRDEKKEKIKSFKKGESKTKNILDETNLNFIYMKIYEYIKKNFKYHPYNRQEKSFDIKEKELKVTIPTLSKLYRNLDFVLNLPNFTDDDNNIIEKKIQRYSKKAEKNRLKYIQQQGKILIPKEIFENGDELKKIYYEISEKHNSAPPKIKFEVKEKTTEDFFVPDEIWISNWKEFIYSYIINAYSSKKLYVRYAPQKRNGEITDTRTIKEMFENQDIPKIKKTGGIITREIGYILYKELEKVNNFVDSKYIIPLLKFPYYPDRTKTYSYEYFEYFNYVIGRVLYKSPVVKDEILEENENLVKRFFKAAYFSNRYRFDKIYEQNFTYEMKNINFSDIYKIRPIKEEKITEESLKNFEIIRPLDTDDYDNVQRIIFNLEETIETNNNFETYTLVPKKVTGPLENQEWNFRRSYFNGNKIIDLNEIQKSGIINPREFAFSLLTDYKRKTEAPSKKNEVPEKANTSKNKIKIEPVKIEISEWDLLELLIKEKVKKELPLIKDEELRDENGKFLEYYEIDINKYYIDESRLSTKKILKTIVFLPLIKELSDYIVGSPNKDGKLIRKPLRFNDIELVRQIMDFKKEQIEMLEKKFEGMPEEYKAIKDILDKNFEDFKRKNEKYSLSFQLNNAKKILSAFEKQELPKIYSKDIAAIFLSDIHNVIMIYRKFFFKEINGIPAKDIYELEEVKRAGKYNEKDTYFPVNVDMLFIMAFLTIREQFAYTVPLTLKFGPKYTDKILTVAFFDKISSVNAYIEALVLNVTNLNILKDKYKLLINNHVFKKPMLFRLNGQTGQKMVTYLEYLKYKYKERYTVHKKNPFEINEKNAVEYSSFPYCYKFFRILGENMKYLFVNINKEEDLIIHSELFKNYTSFVNSMLILDSIIITAKEELQKNEKNDDVELKNFRGNTNRFDVYINKKYMGTINYNLEINKDTFAIENVEQKIRNLIRKVR